MQVTTTAEVTRVVLEDAPPGETASESMTPARKVRLIGRVIDEETEQPIDRFRVLSCAEWRPRLLGEGRNGAFDWELYATTMKEIGRAVPTFPQYAL